MCCLFGLVDIKHQLSGSEKNRIFSVLAECSEARGTDATGYACVSRGKLIIEKQPLPAHKMKFHIPRDAHILMGHTRMTTQGDAQRNRNNHPFLGKIPGIQFALAHNGVLSNDTALRKKHNLPKSRIETDSYVAVQLIENQSCLDMASIRYACEQLKGTFNFTILDRENRLYIAKGNNPLCLSYFKKLGLYMYCSTKLILEEALEEMGYSVFFYEEIRMADGEILQIDSRGNITRDRFKAPVSYNSFDLYNYWEPVTEEPSGYRRYMMDYAVTLGISKKELDWLHYAGFSTFDIEECIYNPSYRTLCLYESGYYDEDEQEDALYEIEYDSFKNYAWT